MSGFWSNVWANLIGTFAGAGLALLSSWLLQRSAERRGQRKLVQAVVDRIGRSRVFARNEREHAGPLSQDERSDLSRSIASILTTRELMSRVLAELGASHRLAPVLEQMTAACALYLRSTEEDADAYIEATLQLREVLTSLVYELVELDSKLTRRGPGEMAFTGRATSTPHD